MSAILGFITVVLWLIVIVGFGGALFIGLFWAFAYVTQGDSDQTFRHREYAPNFCKLVGVAVGAGTILLFL